MKTTIAAALTIAVLIGVPSQARATEETPADASGTQEMVETTPSAQTPLPPRRPAAQRRVRLAQATSPVAPLPAPRIVEKRIPVIWLSMGFGF